MTVHRHLPRGLYAVADTAYLTHERLVSAVERAVRGGARTVQYRDKSHDESRRIDQANTLRTLCTAHGVCFVVNDDVALARAVRADGVHLGREDVSPEAARRDLGANVLVGVSCYNDLARAKQAVAAGANYIAFGSFFPSRTKPKAARAEPALLEAARSFSVPRVAIGGITPENGGSLIAAGADALAVISGLFDQNDIEAAARRYAALFDEQSP